MATELGPGVIRALLAKTVAAAEENTRRALTTTALAVERETKVNLGRGGTHKYGTKTPARPGGPPAIISGTLRRSVTHTPVVRVMTGWETRVGVASGVYPPYGRKKTASSRYGWHLETGLRNGAKYPFLLPAMHLIVPQVRGINATYFKGPWPKI
ncbi:MAG: hypothetical protein JWL97_3554 [Gemmatimonadales bacterium]|nr:hypothetical protein [Gemmatimonadales bacterium]